MARMSPASIDFAAAEGNADFLSSSFDTSPSLVRDLMLEALDPTDWGVTAERKVLE
jgi:hypothetical protein